MTAGLSAAAAVVIWQVWNGEAAAVFSGVTSMVTAVVAVALGLTGPHSSLPTSSDVADRVAVAVGRQWTDEVRLRLVNDPYPLQVRWGPADPDLVDDWPSLVRLAETGLGWPAPPPDGMWAAGPAGLAGSDNDLVDVLDRVPTGRLVVLGEPGAGKTIMLVRLVLDLLDRRNPGGPVPILVSLASWNPVEQDLRSWLVGRLAIDHPGLAEPAPDGTGVSCGRALLEAGLIMAVLDGLDEIPDSQRGPAIARINDALLPGQRLVLAARTAPYLAAVRPAGGVEVRLTGATAIELRPLEAAVVARYLRDSAGGPVGGARWDPVLATFTASDPPPVARALATPLMATLARMIYNPRPGEHPSVVPQPVDLLDPARFPVPEHVKHHLFDALIPAVYREHPNPERRCRWTADQAERWLIFLARDLEHRQHGTTDLAWWELQDAVPRPLPGLTAGIVAAIAGALGLPIPVGFGCGLVAGLTVGLVARSWVPHGNQPVRGGAGGILGGFVGALIALAVFGAGVGTEGPGPSIAGGLAVGAGVAAMGGFRLGLVCGLAGGFLGTLVGNPSVGLAGHLINGLGLGLAVGLAAGLTRRRTPARGLHWSPLGSAIGLTAGLATGYAVWLQVGPIGGLAVGFVSVVVCGFVGGLETAPADLTAASGPDAVLRRDRATWRTTAFAGGLAIGLPTGLAAGLPFGFGPGLGVGIAGCIAAALANGFLRASWGSFTLARWWLAMRRCLPWRLMTFLADAHEQRWVLRQVGGTYQFRHAELQRRLASRS
jgi:hypothetical protein